MPMLIDAPGYSTESGLAPGMHSHTRGKGTLCSWVLLSLLLAQHVGAVVFGQTAPPPDFADVAYGPHPLQTFDLWSAGGKDPKPLVIYFHGGGFTGGDKQKIVPSGLVAKLLARGLSVASANYRLVNDTTKYPIPHQDGARVVQFLRYHALSYNLDPQRVALAGSSAGAHLALWIGLHDDMADSSSTDPIARLSTRVQAVLGYQAPTSGDPNWTFNNIANVQAIYQQSSYFFGIPVSDLMTPSPAVQQILDAASPLKQVSVDDPPVYLVYFGPMTAVPLPPNTSSEVYLHHPMFGVYLKQRLDSVAVSTAVFWGSGGTVDNPMPPDGDVDFLQSVLTPSTGIGTGTDSHSISGIFFSGAPNPFNAGTSLYYRLSARTPVTLLIYDMTGALVTELVRTVQGPGSYRVYWDTRDRLGQVVPSGLYFSVLRTRNRALVRKLTLIR